MAYFEQQRCDVMAMHVGDAVECEKREMAGERDFRHQRFETPAGHRQLIDGVEATFGGVRELPLAARLNDEMMVMVAGAARYEPLPAGAVTFDRP